MVLERKSPTVSINDINVHQVYSKVNIANKRYKNENIEDVSTQSKRIAIRKSNEQKEGGKN